MSRQLNRLVLFISLLGMVLALHLWVQEQRNFDAGCWGAGLNVGGALGGCKNTTLQNASQLMGVSVAALGYWFYFTVAVLSFATVLVSDSLARTCHQAAQLVVAFAFPFTGYLFYVQGFVAHAFCPLCLVSGGFVTMLFLIQAYQYWRVDFEPVTAAARSTEIGFAAGMGLTAMGILAATMVFVDKVATRRLDEGDNAKQFVTLFGQTLPRYIDSGRLAEMKPTLINHELKPLNLKEWVDASTPALGKSDGVAIVAFLDPNCPGCSFEFGQLQMLAQKYKDKAGVYIFSRVLWEYSLLETQALEVAKQKGKYFEMWELEFNARKKGGLSLAEIVPLFARLGIRDADLGAQIAAAKPAVMAVRQKAMMAGINSTPTLFIDGAPVDNLSRDSQTLGRWIEKEAAMREELRRHPAASTAGKTARVQAGGQTTVGG